MNKNKKDKQEDDINQNSEPEEIKSDTADNENSDSAMIDETDSKIVELEAQVKDFQDKLLRKAAEFENYKRRTENDQTNLFKFAAESFIVKLLPVVDDFERSISHMDSAKDVESVKKGIQLIYDKLMKILDEQGVKKIEAVGKPFNVDFHDALLQRRAEDVEPHTVLDEIEKGYLYKDKVIRHSKVIVSEDMAEDSASSQDLNNENKK